MYWMLFLVALLTCVHHVTGACEEHEIEVNSSLCCSQCEPGFGVVTQCSVGNDTSCVQCVEGETFSPSLSHDEPCFTCSLCGKGSHVTSACNETRDTQCECDSLSDSYITRDSLECNLCDLCPAGWGAYVPCTPTSNTLCKQCPNGTYSNVLSATARCSMCSVCSYNQQMLQTCTATQDTICINLDLAIYKHKNKDSKQRYANKTPVKKQPASEDNDIDIIPLYCAILGAVVIGLLGYVVLVHYRRMKEKRLVREPHEDVEYSKASGGDSGIYVEVEHHSKLSPTAIITCSTRIRDLPQSKKRDLEKCFIQSKDPSEWKLLAKELGYNNRRITQLEEQYHRDIGAPVKQVITEWGAGDKATVGTLIQALKNIGRLDILRNLHITNPNELQPLNPHVQQHVL